jgi:hypothetical protein
MAHMLASSIMGYFYIMAGFQKLHALYAFFFCPAQDLCAPSNWLKKLKGWEESPCIIRPAIH